MNSKRRDLEAFLLEIKEFLGRDWFQAECDQAGDIPDPQKTHPIIYSCIKTDNFLKNKRPLPGLRIVPRNEILNVLMIASYLRSINKAIICDLNGNVLEITTKDLFQNRLRTSRLFHSALYEIKVACLYLREGYVVHFIHDKEKHPEFLIELNGEKVYVECKRIEKRRLSRAEGDTIQKLHDEVEKSLIAQKLGVIIICPSEISNPNDWIGKRIKELIGMDEVPIDAKVGEYSLKVFNPSLSARLPGYDPSLNVVSFWEKHWGPFLEKQMKEYSASPQDIVFEVGNPKVSIGEHPSQLFEMESYFGVAFQSLPNIILGIKNSMKKARSQLPKGSNGVIYVEMPPANASDEEINEFGRIVNKELSASSRINALVLTGIVSTSDSVEHIANLIMNTRSSRQLPEGFSVIPLLDRFVLD